MSDDIQKIAEGLSKAAQESITVAAGRHQITADIAHQLLMTGLVQMEFTPLGQQVRAYLQGEWS